MQIDLRSDTVTKPTEAMLVTMMSAQVGDDVFGEDPTVNALEQKSAQMFGFEAGLFCPSGTMTNQIALKVHTQPLDEVIMHRLSHVYNYEVSGYAFHSGVAVRLLEGDNGRINAKDIAPLIQGKNDWEPNTRLVLIENTVNKGGGTVYSLAQMRQVAEVCKQHKLLLHLDGARIFNALVAQNMEAAQLQGMFDSISVCLSKGLGAPVGSVLLGNKQFIAKARKVRKVFGGGMRQAGFLAAAGIYALENNIDRLAEDHRRARVLAETLQQQDYVVEVLPTETNIVIFRLDDKLSGEKFVNRLAENNIKAIAFGPQWIRFVCHLNFTDEMLAEAVSVLQKIGFY
ncbi:MAG: GntG family PLP-dependent aldolase [Chitinophagales bacterium]|nr:aminotransferase class I/II-fold pyridoxal phosphate-dependent enzyme [Bacteroidota bacterium]MCB9043652.1 aminotransferase class I/II-fold pyridoxal phosphate-dependent enzyme [Chitinophagales bacterium]